jgi:glycosyltransferase involved in cell wall biosynthesis
MPSSPAISVVVPLYNEEGNIVELQKEIAAALNGQDYELVLVDDGSTDGTVSQVQRGERGDACGDPLCARRCDCDTGR